MAHLFSRDSVTQCSVFSLFQIQICDAQFKMIDEMKVLDTHWTCFSVNVTFVFRFTL